MRMMTIVVIRMYMRSVFSCSRFLFVSAGKWAYEVLISSQGLMQIGWCTLYCRFNQEVTFIVLLFKVLVILMKQLWRHVNQVCVLSALQEGVGDTIDSYAYDGNRVRKWNLTTSNYGKVTCSCLKVIDCVTSNDCH